MKPVLFVPSNDTMAYWMPSIARRLEKPQWAVIASRREGAPQVLRDQSIPFQTYSFGSIDFNKYSAVILGNDWGLEEQAIVREARATKCKSICIQEGTVTKPYGTKYHECDLFVAASELWARALGAPHAPIGGMPLAAMVAPHIHAWPPYILINCNFTYGVDQTFKQDYLTKALRAAHGHQHTVSVHPRDETDLDKGIAWEEQMFGQAGRWIRSNLQRLHKDLPGTGVVISRNSSVIYEAMMSGCEVIYLRAGESGIFDDYPHSALWYPSEQLSLEQCVDEALHAYVENSEYRFGLRSTFLREHLGPWRYESPIECAKIITSYLEQVS